MTGHGLSIAIVGAGIGGLAAAATLRRVGHDVRIYEQARAFKRLGAGIQQSPNAVKVLRALGLEAQLRTLALRPDAALNRQSDTGEITWERPLGDTVEQKYGAPYLYMHRGDLHAALAGTVPEEIIHRNRKLVGLNQTERRRHPRLRRRQPCRRRHRDRRGRRAFGGAGNPAGR